MYKKVAIFIVIFITSFWFWVVVKNWVYGEVIFRTVSQWIPVVISLVVLSSFTALAFLFMNGENFYTRWAVTWFIALTYMIVFGFSYMNLIALGLIVLLTIAAMRLISDEIRNRIKISPIAALRRGMPVVIIPLLIAISFSYYQNPELAYKFKDKYVPVTVKDVVTNVISNFMQNEPTDKLLGNGDTETKSNITDEAFKYVSDLFFYYTDKYGKYFPPILAFGLFLIMWSISFIFVQLSLLLSALLFEILKKTGFVHIQLEDVKAERLVF